MHLKFTEGHVPMLVSMPHIGVKIPEHYASQFMPVSLNVEDTDWHLSQLYNFLDEMGVSVLQAEISRYVIDLNRPPDNTPMYPGAANTGLCPTQSFSGNSIYKAECEPNAQEIAFRRENYWQPYHDKLNQTLTHIKSEFGYAILWDAHSIRSHLPWLFEGKLPDLNIGTANGLSADHRITNAIAHVCSQQTDFSHVINGRFKGGYITRHYGKPTEHIHAIQLEKCWSIYMSENPPYQLNESLAKKIRPTLKHMMQAALDCAKVIYA